VACEATEEMRLLIQAGNGRQGHGQGTARPSNLQGTTRHRQRY